MAENTWWRDNLWTFNGREVAVVHPAERHLSVICIPAIPELADYIVDLHNKAVRKRADPLAKGSVIAISDEERDAIVA